VWLKLDDVQARNQPKVPKIVCGDRVAAFERAGAAEQIVERDTYAFVRRFRVDLSNDLCCFPGDR